MYIDSVAIDYILVEIEYRLNLPSLGVCQINGQRIKVLLRLEYNQPEKRLLPDVLLAVEGLLFLCLLHVSDFLLVCHLRVAESIQVLAVGHSHFLV